MGWSADALKNGEYLDPVRDGAILQAFAAAMREVQEAAGSADAFLEDGGLHLSACKRELARATGERLDGERWSGEQAAAVCTRARWEVTIATDLVGYWSARRFLEVCREQGLGVELNP
jgi:hypothetical protein